MNYLMGVLAALGGAVDKAVPTQVGNRTKIAVILCPVLGLAASFMPAIPQAAPFVPAVLLLQSLLCAAAPVFAVASLVRDSSVK